jgi:hypothetical protein
VLVLPATIANARGNEQQRAATESTLTHHAMRHNNNASLGCETSFRPARKMNWAVLRIVVVEDQG